MTMLGWAQIAIILALTFATASLLGRHIARIIQGERTFLSPLADPAERWILALSGVDSRRGMDWKSYAYALLLLNFLHFLLLYAILRLQFFLPFNPLRIPGMPPALAFNAAVSFTTNTNWQSYAPESQISIGAQMFGLTVHMFLSAATGIAAAAAVMRAFAAGRLKVLGNFYVDIVRVTLHLLVPVAIIAAVALIACGVPQTLIATVAAHTLHGGTQMIAMGPVAFQEAIKEFGTNGGGFFNANSAHPFENPSALSDILENVLMLAIPFALPLSFGRIIGKPAQGRALFIVMAVLLALGVAGTYAAESGGNPLTIAAGVAAHPGNMEGKEVRLGVALSSLFNVSATGTSTGAVNAATDSFTPLGGAVPLFMMQLGELTPGGVGSGFYTIIVFALLAVFVAGLMVGRTPEYLGKKVQAREVKLAMLAVLVLALFIMGGASLSLVLPQGTASLANAGPHGLSEMLYAWTSATENNGSAFAGISANTGLLNYGLGTAMLFGRFAFLVPVLAIAGSLGEKPQLPPGSGTFPTTGPLFIGLLIGVILILGGLQFMPADALGPIAEHVAMIAGKTF